MPHSRSEGLEPAGNFPQRCTEVGYDHQASMRTPGGLKNTSMGSKFGSMIPGLKQTPIQGGDYGHQYSDDTGKDRQP